MATDAKLYTGKNSRLLAFSDVLNGSLIRAEKKNYEQICGKYSPSNGRSFVPFFTSHKDALNVAPALESHPTRADLMHPAGSS